MEIGIQVTLRKTPCMVEVSHVRQTTIQVPEITRNDLILTNEYQLDLLPMAGETREILIQDQS